MKIEILVNDRTFQAELNDGPTARRVAELLPLTGSANVWGDEIYFDIPLQVAEEPAAKQEVPVGTLAYWPPGNAFCIFYGPTPVSEDATPRAYSPVNLLGRVIGDATLFREVIGGTLVTLTKAAD